MWPFYYVLKSFFRVKNAFLWCFFAARCLKRNTVNEMIRCSTLCAPAFVRCRDCSSVGCRYRAQCTVQRQRGDTCQCRTSAGRCHRVAANTCLPSPCWWPSASVHQGGRRAREVSGHVARRHRVASLAHSAIIQSFISDSRWSCAFYFQRPATEIISNIVESYNVPKINKARSTLGMPNGVSPTPRASPARAAPLAATLLRSAAVFV